MLWWFAQTTLVAGGLAALAALAGRWKRLGPEARHALWLLVLLKLAAPPLVEWPWPLTAGRAEGVAAPAPVTPFEPRLVPARIEPEPLAEVEAFPEVVSDPLDAPEPAATASATVAVAVAEPDPIAVDEPAETPPPPPQARPWAIPDGRSALLAAWLVGSVAVVARRVVLIGRFRRGLAGSTPAPAWLVEEARDLAARVGVRPPRIEVHPRLDTPLLWCLGRPRMVVPAGLVGRLKPDHWAGVLAHELAHLARRDHWVVRLELVVEAFWWWNPLFWLARRRLHEEAELACDARVVRALPGLRLAYAEALVDVCEQIARASTPSPALGVGGAGAARSLEGRLEMILRDPTPRRPGRRGRPVALALAALALPAWTLGQAPQAEVPKAEAPKAEAPPLQADAKPATVTINQIRAARLAAKEGLGVLSFRYVVDGRDRTRSRPIMGGMGGMGGGMGGMGGGFVGGGGGGGVMIGGGGRGGGMAGGGGMGGMMMMGGGAPRQRVKSVHVQVADVTLGPDGFGPDRFSRLDVLDSRPPTWDRRFVAKDSSGFMVLKAGDKEGPVPFRWVEALNRGATVGDSLAMSLSNSNGMSVLDTDPGIDPLDPRPANVLDLAGATTLFLDQSGHNVEVAGTDAIDGREVVRVAWFSGNLRGLCWLAPEYGYAVVRSDATMDPVMAGGGRKLWRKRASDFAKVANLWLPGKVTYEEIEADPAGGEPFGRLERTMSFEDYRATPEATAETFHPKLAIQDLDDLTGNFTAKPPALPAGLPDRLKRAVAESPYGPPMTERVAEKSEPEAAPSPMYAPAQQEPARIAPAAPKAEAPAPARPEPANGDEVEIERRFRLDREVIALANQMMQAKNKLDEVKRITVNPDEPAERAASRKLQALKAQYEQLWEAKSIEIRNKLALGGRAEGEPVEVLAARRDGKAAEVRKAEAQAALARAVPARNQALKAKGANFISNEEFVKGEAEAAIAEAELGIARAGLAEAEARLARAGGAKAGDRQAPDRSPSQAELLDAVEVLEVQLEGKRAELRGAESAANVATRQASRIDELVKQGRVVQKLAEEATEKADLARSQLDAKKAEVQEFEVRLKQARRRVEANEARLRREVERAKVEVGNARKLFASGGLTIDQVNAIQARLDELMIQLDPKYNPPAPPEAPKAAPVPAAN